MSNGIKHTQVITSLCYRLKLLTDTKLTGVRRFTQLQHIYSIKRVISSFEKSGIEVTPSRISSNSRMTWVLANESADGGAAITAMARRAQPSAPQYSQFMSRCWNTGIQIPIFIGQVIGNVRIIWEPIQYRGGNLMNRIKFLYYFLPKITTCAMFFVPLTDSYT